MNHNKTTEAANETTQQKQKASQHVRDVNSTEGSEFLDDRLRMKDQPIEDTEKNNTFNHS